MCRQSTFPLLILLVVGALSAGKSHAARANFTFDGFVTHWSRAINATLEHYVSLTSPSLEAISGDISPACRQAGQLFLDGLRRGEVWPFKMLDASSRVPWSGVVDGTISSLGNYDQCFDYQFDRPPVEMQFCSVSLKLPIPVTDSQLRLKRPTLSWSASSPWSSTPLFRHYSRLLAIYQLTEPLGNRLGVCLPRSCSTADMQLVLDEVVSPLVESRLLISDGACSWPGKSAPITQDQNVALAIFRILFALVVIGTVVHVTARELCMKVPLARYVQCFSLVHNMGKLFEVDRRARSSPLAFIHGWRVINSTLILLSHVFGLIGHDYVFMVDRTSFVMWDLLSRPSTSFANTAIFQLEGFFFMSGLVLAYTMLPELQSRKGKFSLANYGVYVAHRWMRSAPSILGIICVLLVTPRLEGGWWGDPFNFGMGPVYRETIQELVEPCRRYWWRNFLQIQNYFEINQNCLPEIWFLSADFALYCLAPIAFVTLYRFGDRAARWLWGVIAGAIMVSFLQIYSDSNDLLPTLSSDLLDSRNADHFYQSVIHPIIRHVPTYGLGLFVGYMALKRKDSPNRIHPLIKWTATCVTILTTYFLLWIAHVWRQESYDGPTKFYASLYAALYPLAWSSFTGWLAYLCLTNQGGVAQRFLSSPVWFPMSRLTFQIYLCNLTVINVRLASLKRTIDMADTFGLISTGMLCASLTVCLALCLSMLFEMPFAQLEKLILMPSKREATVAKGMSPLPNGRDPHEAKDENANEKVPVKSDEKAKNR